VIDIGAIGFDKGHVTLDDQTLKTNLDVLIDPLGKPIPYSDIVGAKAAKTAQDKGGAPQDYAFALKVKGQYHGQNLTGQGKIGGLLALQDASKPFPLQAQAKIGDTSIELAGTLTDPMNLGALDLRLKLAGASLGNLYPLTGVTLPDTPPYSTDGHLIAKLHDAAGAKFTYEQFNGKIGSSDIHGDLTYVASQPRPKLSGALLSNQLLFADLAPLIGADSNDKQKARGGDSKQPADKVLPVEEFKTDRWRAMDADVEFTGKRIVHSEKLPFNDLYTHLKLNDGELSLEPLRFGVAGGNLDAQIRLNGRTEPMEGQAKLTARRFKLKELFPTFEPMKTSFGELNGDADISGRGNSVAKLLGGANGKLKMLINDGAISRELMELAGLNVGNYVVGKIFGDKEVKINCAAADFDIKNRSGDHAAVCLRYRERDHLYRWHGEHGHRAARPDSDAGIEGLAFDLPAFAAVRAWQVHQTGRRGEGCAADVAWGGDGCPGCDCSAGGGAVGAGGTKWRRAESVCAVAGADEGGQGAGHR
jgi:uncharacterized protein involved in outer membrane biogenesis